MVHLRFRSARVNCPRCEAVKTEAVSWAAPGANFTYAFEERVAYLAQQSSKTAVTKHPLKARESPKTSPALRRGTRRWLPTLHVECP